MTPQAPSDPPLRFLPSGLAWTDEGDPGAPAIVCLHGLPGSHRDFRWLSPALLPRFRVIRLDFPGFGASPGGQALGEEGRAAVVSGVLDAAGVDRAVVLGHSVGGAVATAFAARHPSRVSALALVASAGPRPHFGFRIAGFGLLQAGLDRPLLRRPTLYLVRRLYISAGFPRSLKDPELEATTRAAVLVDFEAHRERLRATRLPTLVAYAEDDRIVEKAVFEDLSALAPSGPRLVFPTGGHNIQKTMAVELAEGLGALLGR